MHLANQSSGKPGMLSRVHQARQAIPEFNGEGTLDIREAHRLQGVQSAKENQRGQPEMGEC